ncbi:MAG: 50S ribosomal protein L15 [Candidatus Omnitrophica bacterium]|nr:50S ribosomal protein L15 [Candidatus Omnitrophota bacterium]
MQVHNLKSPKGSRKAKRIVGRGNGSGRGKTSGRGENGQGSREGRGTLRQSEGGQMPLIRRLPKVGFRSHRPIVYQLITLSQLEAFDNDIIVNAQLLKEKGFIKNIYKPFKVLGNGEISTPLTVQATSFSKTAADKIAKAGGKTETVDAKKIKESVLAAQN